MKKEDFIEKTLNSIIGIKTASANDFLYTRVIARIENSKSTQYILFNHKFTKFVFYSLSLLLVFNFFFFLKQTDVNNNSAVNVYNNHIDYLPSYYYNY